MIKTKAVAAHTVLALFGFAGVSSTGAAASANASSVTESTVYSFKGLAAVNTDGIGPNGIVQASDGNFYGVTGNGGATDGVSSSCSGGNGDGILFRVTPSGEETILYSFTCGASGSTVGGVPTGSLILGKDGALYGTTGGGEAYGVAGLPGSVFKFTLAGVETILHAFPQPAGASSDGEAPNTLVSGSDGNFYGTSQAGGTAGVGTVFQVTPAGVETVLHTFTGGVSGSTDGAVPRSALIQASDGSFYGTTSTGGLHGVGTVFKITPAGQESVLYSFSGGVNGSLDGATPSAALVQEKDGTLYGTTYYGGASSTGVGTGVGTVFQITLAGAEKILYSFAPTNDGQHPLKLLIASDGGLYGITQFGGATATATSLAGGTVYRLTLTGTETILYSFSGGITSIGSTDGGLPLDLIQGADGNFYGATLTGGTFAYGTIFKLSGVGTGLSSGGTAGGGQTNYLGDGNAGYTVWRSLTGYWYSTDSTGASAAIQFGAPADLPVIGDFDGDGKSDFAVFRPLTGYWYIKRSSDAQVVAQQFGAATDVPVAGDFDGDGKTDLAVYRPVTGYWYITRSSDKAVEAKQFGAPTDTPVVGDFDGDGKSDLAVFRPSTGYWYITQSSNNTVVAKQWGAATDVPVSADFDGDGKTDIAVYRPSTGYWYIVQSSDGQVVAKQWGASGDVPVARDYDGDGKTDIAVWRPSTGFWYVLQSSSGQTLAKQWGAPMDIAVNSVTR